MEPSSIWIFFAAEELASIFSILQSWLGGQFDVDDDSFLGGPDGV
jgi:hypothetical protein